MPSIHRAVEVKLPDAEALADLYSIVFDLDAATYLCEKAVELGRLTKHDSLLVEGLVAAALVRYCRCFSSGPRLGLRRQDIEILNNEDLAAHDYFKNLRDKFVAHSVNPFEETYVIATASERDGVKYSIQSVGAGQHRLMLSVGTAEALSALASKVKAIVHKRVKKEKTQLVKRLQALPLETIHSGDLHTPHTFKSSDVGKSRKQTSRSSPSLQGVRGKRRASER